jgi:hypothetical protein
VAFENNFFLIQPIRKHYRPSSHIEFWNEKIITNNADWIVKDDNSN